MRHAFEIVALAGLRDGGDAVGVKGRSAIDHKDPDDFTTQPTGISKARIACGVIREP